jgi:hypothetical protein
MEEVHENLRQGEQVKPGFLFRVVETVGAFPIGGYDSFQLDVGEYVIFLRERVSRSSVIWNVCLTRRGVAEFQPTAFVNRLERQRCGI